jgi:hypothetical protein
VCYIEQCVVTIAGALMPQYIVISRNIYCYPVGSLKDCDHLIQFGMPILANSCPNANFESMELVIICCDIFFILRVQDVDLFKELYILEIFRGW